MFYFISVKRSLKALGLTDRRLFLDLDRFDVLDYEIKNIENQ